MQWLNRRNWFFFGLAGVILAVGVVHSGSGSGRGITPLPDPRAPVYKGVKDFETLLYIRDVSGQIQKEHQMILESLDQMQRKIEDLERKIESSKNIP